MALVRCSLGCGIHNLLELHALAASHAARCGDDHTRAATTGPTLMQAPWAQMLPQQWPACRQAAYKGCCRPPQQAGSSSKLVMIQHAYIGFYVYMCVHALAGRNRVRACLASQRGAPAVHAALRQALGGEAAKDDGMHGAQARACQHRNCVTGSLMAN